MGFTEEVQGKLKKPLSPALPKTLKGNRYLEGHVVISQANRIFGFDQWGYDVLDLRLNEVDTKDKQGNSTKAYGYSATVRVEVIGAPPRTDVGFSTVAEWKSGYHPDAHDTAMKGAVTDAMKRPCARSGISSATASTATEPTSRRSRTSRRRTKPRHRSSRPHRRRRTAMARCRAATLAGWAMRMRRGPTVRCSPRSSAWAPSERRGPVDARRHCRAFGSVGVRQARVRHPRTEPARSAQAHAGAQGAGRGEVMNWERQKDGSYIARPELNIVLWVGKEDRHWWGKAHQFGDYIFGSARTMFDTKGQATDWIVGWYNNWKKD